MILDLSLSIINAYKFFSSISQWWYIRNLSLFDSRQTRPVTRNTGQDLFKIILAQGYYRMIVLEFLKTYICILLPGSAEGFKNKKSFKSKCIFKPFILFKKHWYFVNMLGISDCSSCLKYSLNTSFAIECYFFL